jgi:hypothetical protein
MRPKGAACHDVAPTPVGELLKCFFIGTHNVSPADQIIELADLPIEGQERIHASQARGLGWTAWSTASGPIVAWATYDIEGSKRLHA